MMLRPMALGIPGLHSNTAIKRRAIDSNQSTPHIPPYTANCKLSNPSSIFFFTFYFHHSYYYFSFFITLKYFAQCSQQVIFSPVALSTSFNSDFLTLLLQIGQIFTNHINFSLANTVNYLIKNQAVCKVSFF